MKLIKNAKKFLDSEKGPMIIVLTLTFLFIIVVNFVGEVKPRLKQYSDKNTNSNSIKHVQRMFQNQMNHQAIKAW